MFLAVSNFAAAPTGSSLITKFFKQPSASAQTSQAESSSAAEAGQRHVEVEDAVPASHVGPHVGPHVEPHVGPRAEPHIDSMVTDPGQQTDMIVTDQGLQAAAPGSDPGLQAKTPDPMTRGPTQLAGKLQQPHAINPGLQAAALRAEQQADGHRLAEQTPVLPSQLQHHRRPIQALSARAAAVSASTSESVDLQRAASRSPEPAQMPAQSPVPAAAEAGAAERPLQTEVAGVEVAAHADARAGLKPLQCLQQRDQQGSEGQEDSEGVQQVSEVGQMPGSHGSLTCGKRPLEQSFSKEPEHRKRPNRYVHFVQSVNNISTLHCCLVSTGLKFGERICSFATIPIVLATFLKRPTACRVCPLSVYGCCAGSSLHTGCIITSFILATTGL